MYEIPSVTNDLRSEETYVQIATSLKYLQKVSEVIFDKINTRLNFYEKKINNFNERLNFLYNSVEKLSKSTKNLEISSPITLPSSSSNYKSIFRNKEDIFMDYHINFNQCSLQKTKQFSNSLPLFQVDVDSNYMKSKSNSLNLLGFGSSIRKDVQYFVDLFLFNTYLNIYDYRNLKDFRSCDQFPKNIRFEIDRHHKILINNSEKYSNINENENEENHLENIDFYLPEVLQVPNLDLTKKLPTCFEFVDYLHTHTNGNEHKIEQHIEHVNNTDNIDLSKDEILNFDKINSAEDERNLNKSTKVYKMISTNDDNVLLNENRSEPEHELKSKNLINVPVDDLRTNLMKSIRDFGGMNNFGLKSIKNSNKKCEKPEESNDLIADLSRVLNLRRKGIHGHAITESEKKTGNIFDNISNLISQTKSSSESDNSEDEQDSETDWN